MKTRIWIALILAFFFSPAAWAADEASEAMSAEARATERPQAGGRVDEQRRKIIGEAQTALAETRDALEHLDNNKPEQALEALARATGKLEIIIAREPELALAPSDVKTTTYDIIGDIKAVRSIRRQAEDALEEGRVQVARRLLSDLASETVISVTNIPLATYPAAITYAAALIDDGQVEEAKKILSTALNTLVVTDTIVPLPVVAAEELLAEAEKLAEQNDRSESQNERLSELLSEARTELEFAQALGYGSKKDFRELYSQLDKIEKRTSGGKSGTGLFDRIKSLLRGVVASGQSDTTIGGSAD